MKRILALVLCASCSWGLGESRGYIAARNMASAHETVAHADIIIDAIECAPEEVKQEILPHAEAIKERALDVAEIAIMEADDHGFRPKETPELDSEEDVREVNIYAGKSNKRATRRRKFKEFPGKLVGFIAGIVKSATPAWAKWLLSIAVVVIVVSFVANVVLWIRARFNRKAAEQMVVLGNQYIPKTVLEETRGTPAQRVFKDAQRRGLVDSRNKAPAPKVK